MTLRSPARSAGAFGLTIVVLLAAAPAVAIATHPLDALDDAEIAATVAILRAADRADADTVFHSISLLEPAKDLVYAWRAGQAIPRAAAVVLRDGGKTYEAKVDLDARKVLSFEQATGGQPVIVTPELISAPAVTLADPRMQAGLRKRGVTDFTQLFCAARTAGNFGHRHETEHRIVKVDCFDTRGVTTDVFATPIEGLFATVDLDAKSVLEVTDLGVVPIPPGEHDFDRATLGRVRESRPVTQAAPQGSNVTFDQSFVRWENWSFHLRWDIRAGTVISLASYTDHGKTRPILYQGSLSEIFVPYQDPTVAWYFRNYMDQGEYGVGTMSSPLAKGVDCPANAAYMPAAMSNAAGGTDTLEDRICVFERTLSQPIWRHFDFMTQALGPRPSSWCAPSPPSATTTTSSTGCSTTVAASRSAAAPPASIRSRACAR